MADKIVVTPKGRRLSVPDDADAETVASLIDQTDALPEPVKPEGALSRFGSALWQGVNPVNTVKGLINMAMSPQKTSEALKGAALAHGVNALDSAYKAIAPRPNQPAGTDKLLDRLGAAGEAFRQGVGVLLPGTVERGDRLLKGDTAGALGDQTAFTANLFAPEAAGGLVKLAKPAMEARAVSALQNARAIEDPAAARSLLEQGKGGGNYADLNAVKQNAIARTREVQTPVQSPNPIVSASGESLPTTMTETTKVQDPTAWKAYYGLKSSLEKPSPSPFHEAVAGGIGRTMAGKPGEAVGVAASVMGRTHPRAKFAQLLYDAAQGNPKLSELMRQALLAKFATSDHGGS